MNLQMNHDGTITHRASHAASRLRRRAFSLVELVIVVVIIAIIGAIAIPRLSRGAAGASDSALIADLAILRSAIDLYTTEHAGTGPGATIVNQLTLYSDAAGATSATKTATHIYGPYLRTVPPLPVGTKRGKNGVFVETVAANNPPGGAATDGWWYNSATGVIRPNLAAAETDDAGVAYNAY
ncbi:MAG: prepilin-type N-terminal cleavage/methylation domain-containing protein [Phycisphaerales bacterium]|nr:prepilin-type N-terminal cleavage/methylation domain-containing protein [Phycisphaerales bacterium]